MCSCNSKFVFTTYYTKICTSCGVEQSGELTQEIIYMPGANLNRSYSRNERWRNLTRKITGYHCGPPTRDPVWNYLHSQKPFNSPADILASLRVSKLLNKHYQNLYIFTKIFAPKHDLPEFDPDVCSKMITYFDFVYQIWNRHFGQRPFFSYNWLLEQALELFNYTQFIPFVKRLVCPKRRRKYENLLIKLYGIQLGLENYKQQPVHSRCEKSSSSNHRNQLYVHGNLFLPLEVLHK